MNKISYTLHRSGERKENHQKRYRCSELERMTNYQLREICFRESLVKNTIAALKREELIRLIMRYRGKDETAWIREDCDGGMENLDTAFRKVKLIEKDDMEIRIPAKIMVYLETDLDYFDRIQVKTSEELDEGNLLLADEQNYIYTVLNLEKKPDHTYYITKSCGIPVRELQRKQYSILYLGEAGSDILYDLYYGKTNIFPPSLTIHRIPIIDFQIGVLKEADSSLVIDFGSSNTTLGTYEKKMEYRLVNVLNRSTEEWQETPVIPSVIGVRDIQDSKIVFEFGYQAQEMLRKNYLDEELSVFYDIKRWVNDSYRQEKVISADGAYTWLKRSDMLKAYLEYLIGLAVQRFKKTFKKIQILTPVRQKEKFKRVFQELLSDYEVDCSLDEGVAVLFHSIQNLIQSDQYGHNQWYKALIIDCGGGTTDLTSSSFKIDNNRVSYRIELESSYENGDTNFGGNNLTFRLMQLLKIRLAEQFTRNEIAEKMICLTQENFRLIDEYGIQNVYQELDDAYEEAEKIIPTRFAEYEQAGAPEYFKVKNNFFYLFELAEEMKKMFFAETEFYEIAVSWKDDRSQNRRTGLIPMDKWKFSVKSGERFLNELPPGEAMFYLYEIRALLLPDVYALVKKFLEKDFQKGQLGQYRLIKLTGQTCQAGLFTEALKEYIPGRVLQNTKKKDPHELKVCCLSGALFYFQNKKMGYMDIVHHYETGALPYEIVAYTHENKEKALVNSLKKTETTGHISRFMEGDQVELFLRDTQAGMLKRYLYRYHPDDLNQTTFEEIEQFYPEKITQSETDNIVNGESKFFVWASREEWGFYIFPVLRRDGMLYCGNAKFYDFEDDTWERNYFDGKK